MNRQSNSLSFNPMSLIVFCFLSVIIVMPLGYADTVLLKSGKAIEGKIWKEDADSITIIVDTASGLTPMPLKKTDVDTFEKKSGGENIIEQCVQSFSFLRQGMQSYKRNQFDQAIEFFNKTVELNPKLAGVHYYIGLSYNNLEKYSDAVPAFQKELEINPKNADSYFALGYAYFALNQNESAKGSFTKAKELLQSKGEQEKVKIIDELLSKIP